MRKTILFITVFFVVNFIWAQTPVKLTPSSYSINTPNSSYPDTNPTSRLTDGVKATCTWGMTTGCTLVNTHFVGWNAQNPVITFNFSSSVTVQAVKLWLGDSDGAAGVALPTAISIGTNSDNQNIPIPNPPGMGVREITIPLVQSINASSFSITLTRNGGNFVMVSEIELYDRVPLDNDYTYTNSNNISVNVGFSGSGSITKAGTGQLTLQGGNNFTGGVAINGNSGSANILVAGSNTAFGMGTVNVNGANNNNGGTLDLSGRTIANNINIANKNYGTGGGPIGALMNGNTSTTAVLNGTLNIGGENYVGGNGNITFNGVVSGGLNNVYSFYKQGTGTWRFNNAANTFDGFYYLVGGATEVTSLANMNQNSALGRPTNTSNNRFIYTGSGGVLRFVGGTSNSSDRAFVLSGTVNEIDISSTNNAILTLTGVISGGGNLRKSGEGSLRLSGANTYSGGTTILAGRLISQHNNIPGGVVNNSQLEFNQTSNGTYSGAISGTGALFKTGNSNLTLTGSNTFTGGVTVSAGRLIGNASSLVGAIVNNTELELNQTTTGASSMTISGPGIVYKTGNGELTLNGASTYSGGTVFSEGTLRLGDNNALGTGALTISANNLTLSTSANRSIPNGIILNNNATVATGTNTFAINGNITGTGKLTKTGTGTLTLGGNNTFSGGFFITGGSGQNSIVKATSAHAFGTGLIEIGGGPASTGSTLDLNGQTLTNDISILNKNSGVGDQGAIINTDVNNPATLNGTVQIGGEIYAGGNGDIIFNSLVTGGLNNIYSIYKMGNSNWRFTNDANTFDGFFYLIGGSVEVTSLANAGQASSLGQVSTSQNQVKFGFANQGGGSLRFVGSNPSVSNRNFEILGANNITNRIDANGVNNNATLTLNGSFSALRNAAFTIALGGNNTGNNTYGGVISNGSGTISLVKDGPGTWRLSGINTYTGSTTVSAGRLITDHNNIPGNITNNSQLEFNLNSNQTYAHIVSGSGAVFKSGSGNLTLSGINTYTGGTNITAGRLIVRHNNITGEITNNSQLEFNQTSNGTYSGAISGTGTLFKTGTSNLTLTGNNSYTGVTTISEGRLIGNTTSLPGDITNNAQVEFNQTSDGTFASVISGTGALFKTGNSNLTLTGNHTYTGSTTIQNGELRVNSDISSSSGITVASTATLSGVGTLPATEVFGIHNPGSSAGVQTVDGDITYKTGSTLNWELFANAIGIRGTDYDGINVTGDLDFEGTTTLNLVFNASGSAVDFADNFWAGTYTDANGWLLFDVTGSSSSISNLSNLSIVVGNDKDEVTLSTAQPDANGFSLKVVNNKVYLQYTNGSRWTGATSTDWHTTSNWEPERVPDQDMVAYIGNVINQPIAGADVSIKILNLETDQSQLSINPTHVLTVGQAIRNNGQIIFKSDAIGSGMFDQFTGTITGNGTVQVERYIPARRAFRFVTSAVTTTSSIRQNWQEDGGSVPGLGTHITGAGGATNGFDATALNNPSMFTFNASGWQAVTNTHGVLTAGTPYRLMVRGDRITDLTTNTPNLSITKLRATGALYTGNFMPALNQTALGYSLVGNPYQAPMDMKVALAGSTNLDKLVLYYWDPTLNTRGAYVTRTLSANTNVPSDSNFTEILQPGQAVFVKKDDTVSTASMTIAETHKRVDQGSAGVFRTSNFLSDVGMIRVNLQANVQNVWQTIEGALAIFNDDYSWAVTPEDATKMGNLDEEVSFMLDGTALAIAFQNEASVTSTLPIQINKMRHTDYQWTFDLDNYSGLTPMLWDEQTQTMTAITNTTVIPFSTTTTATDRFKIVFQETMHLDDFSLNVSLYPNPGKSNQSFYLSGVTEAKVSMQSLLGQEIPVTTHQNGQTMEVKPDTALSAGVYFVSVTQAGKTAQVKWIVE